MKERLNYANVVATLALVGVIAGGTAIALPGKNSVQSNDLKKNSVRAKAIKANAVRSAEIEDGAVGSADVADQGLQYGDLGSNSVIARIRTTQPVSSAGTTEANPASVPLTGNTWSQAANETQVFIAEATRTAGTCTNGDLIVEFVLDGELVDDATDSISEVPSGTQTVPTLESRPYIFEPGAAKQHSLAMRLYDSCDNPGEDFTLESYKVNVIGIR